MVLTTQSWRQTFDEWFVRLDQPVPAGPKWYPTSKMPLDVFTGDPVHGDSAADKDHGTLGV